MAKLRKEQDEEILGLKKVWDEMKQTNNEELKMYESVSKDLKDRLMEDEMGGSVNYYLKLFIVEKLKYFMNLRKEFAIEITELSFRMRTNRGFFNGKEPNQVTYSQFQEYSFSKTPNEDK